MRGFWVMIATIVFITVLGLVILYFTPADDDTAAKRR